ncbi:MAG: glycosyl hydrolase [Verrucomicrobiota bacterium]
MSTIHPAINGTRTKRWVVRAMLLLALVLTSARTVVVLGADTPVTPNASPQVQSLLAYFSDIYGKKIISGQQEGWRGTNDLCFELNYLTNTTGKLPALLAMDLSGYTGPSRGHDTNHTLARHAIDWYQTRHGIVEFCWHWRAPMNEPAFYTKDTTFDLARGLTEGTPENEALLRDLDKIAGELEVLRDAHVPVLWRPLHEANGRWFWWGAQGPEPLRKLWRLMFENFTAKHKLNNLIWVFSPGAETDLADWYPGDAYVDIIGQDHYPMDGNHGTAKDIFDELTAFGRRQKLIALGENGPIPDVNGLVREKAGWLFFTTWSGPVLTEKNSPEQLREWFNNPYVLNLGDLPDFDHYPFQPAGPAVRLGFAAAPGDVAVGGLRRLPVTVAVQDKTGRTVRTGTFTVTLALEKTSPGGALSGTLTATTVNGIATFPDLKINKAGDHYTFIAKTDGLRSAASPAFQVGPGAGIARDWWTNLKDVNLTDLDNLAEPPTGREILGKAFETPVSVATNFEARYQGFLIPPITGTYKFWIANESVSELWLSADATPSKKTKIAEVTRSTPYRKWPHTHEAESISVTLEAGKRYYLEALQQQQSGSTQLAVRWQLPNGVEERPIPGWRLVPPDGEWFKPPSPSTTTAQAQ